MKLYLNFFRLLLILSLTSACTEPPKENEGETSVGGEETMDMRPGFNPFADMNTSPDMLSDETDLAPMEANPCMDDEGCFAGRICQEGMCVDADCQSDADCPSDRPICAGPEGEEPAQRRGRCGDCRSNDDCYGANTCELLTTDSEEEDQVGLCTLAGACEGSLECAPSSRLVMNGMNQEVCLDQSISQNDSECVSAFNCQAEDECPTGLTCLESGQCATLALNVECESSEQCGFDDVCRLDGICGACQRDADCGDAQSCTQGNCVEIPGACSDDSHCLGARICISGECATPDSNCTEDGFGDHETFDQAVEITGDRVYRKMISCKDDWYQFTLPPAMSTLIAVRQKDRGANLGLVVVDAQERELGRSVGAAPLEAVRLRESTAPRVIYVRVFQEGPASVTEYDLEISYHESNDEICLDDPYELSAGDDDFSRARLFRSSVTESFPAEIQGQICPNDQDVICFHLEFSENLTIKGKVDLGDALVQGTLVNPNGDTIAEGSWSRDQNPVDIAQTINDAGRHCLLLNSDVSDNRRLGGGRYSLEIKTVSPQLANLCESSEEISIENNRGNISGVLEGSNVLVATCAPESNGPESVYHVNVTAPSLLVARLTGLSAGTLGDPVISVRSQCDQNTTELACSSRSYDLNNPFVIPPNPAILRTALNPEPDPVSGAISSRYTVVVDGVEVGMSPNFQLNVELRPLAAPPVNDRCDRVSTLTFDNGVSVTEAYLDQAQNDNVDCGEGGPDVMYSFTVEESSRVRVQAVSKPSEFPVLIALGENCGQSTLACGFTTDQILNPGEYFITLAGLDQNSRGLVELQVVLDPLLDVPTNETCDQAVALEGDQGSIAGNTQGAQDDYSLSNNNRCTNYNSNGGDLIYSIQGRANIPVTIEVIPELGWDTSLYLLSSCTEGDPVNACLAGQDAALTESITYTPTQDELIYIVVDGSNREAGAFELTWEHAVP